jgi:hypothetical protein
MSLISDALKGTFKNHAPATLLGALAGIGLVVWVGPATSGGISLLIVVPVIMCVAISVIYQFFSRSRGS